MQSIDSYSNVGVPGRYIFRIDEWIQAAGCLDLDFGQESECYFYSTACLPAYHLLFYCDRL